MLTTYFLFGVWKFSLFAPLAMIVAELLFLFHLKKRQKFAWRLTGVLVLYLLFLLFVPPNYKIDYIEDIFTDISVNFYSVIYWLAVYFISVILFFFCFDAEKRTVLFFCASGYCTQHIVTNLSRIIETAINLQSDLITLSLQFSICIIVFPVFWLCFIRKICYKQGFSMDSGYVVLFSTLAIFINTVLSMIFRLELVGPIADIIQNLYSIISCILVLLLQYGVFMRKELQYELNIVKHMWKKDRQQYLFRKEYIDAINIKCHDLKHMLNVRRENAVYQADLCKNIDLYDSLFETGNQALDIVLSEKGIYCSNNQIRLTCSIDGKRLSFIEDADIYSCIGNALDNAIEAVQEMCGERRSISLSMAEQGSMILLIVQNYCKAKVDWQGGFPVTTKADKLNHGFGLKSMELVAKKYGGKISCQSEDDVFTLKIFLQSDGR